MNRDDLAAARLVTRDKIEEALRVHLWLTAAPWPDGADALWPSRLADRVWAALPPTGSPGTEPDLMRLIEACERADIEGTLPDTVSAALAVVHGLVPSPGTRTATLLAALPPTGSPETLRAGENVAAVMEADEAVRADLASYTGSARGMYATGLLLELQRRGFVVVPLAEWQARAALEGSPK